MPFVNWNFNTLQEQIKLYRLVIWMLSVINGEDSWINALIDNFEPMVRRFSFRKRLCNDLIEPSHQQKSKWICTEAYLRKRNSQDTSLCKMSRNKSNCDWLAQFKNEKIVFVYCLCALKRENTHTFLSATRRS